MIVNTKSNYEKEYVIENANSIKHQRMEYNPSDSNDLKTNDMINSAVSMEISKRGLAIVGELREFDDTYETRRMLTYGIGSHELIDGSYMDILSQNYQEELERLKEKYSSDAYDKQLTHLNKAYDEAADMISRNYVKQLRILTGDVELKPKAVHAYSTKEKAEEAISVENNTTDSKKYVIRTDMAELMSSDIKNMLLQMKNTQIQTHNLSSEYLSYSDMKNIGRVFLNKSTASNTNVFSDFAKSLIQKYNSINR